MNEIYRKTRAAYDRLAEEYARRNHDNMPETLITLAKHLLFLTGPKPHILDAGCGTGRDMAWFEEHEAAVTGIDLSANMLSIAERHVNGNLLQTKIPAFPFKDDSFDAIWCCASFLHLPKKEAPSGLMEMYRVLKPDHPLVLCIQEGTGEIWDTGYVEGVYRFFARYTQDEMETMLDQNFFKIKYTERSQNGNRKWLSFLCVAG